MKIAVVDDEEVFREEMKKLLEEISEEIKVPFQIDLFENGVSFLNRGGYYECILMDLEMEPIKGDDVIRRYRERHKNSSAVMVTSREDRWGDGYEAGAKNYLIKPAKKEKVKAELEKVIQERRDRMMFVLGAEGGRRVEMEEIYYIQPDPKGRGTLVVTATEILEDRRNMKEIMAVLNDEVFFRINKTYIINLNHIKNIKFLNKKVELWMPNGELMKVGSRCYAHFVKVFMYHASTLYT